MQEDPWVSYFDFEKYGFGINPASGRPYSRVNLAKMIRAGAFPKPMQVSPNRIAWRLSSLRHHERQVEVGRAYREPADAA